MSLHCTDDCGAYLTEVQPGWFECGFCGAKKIIPVEQAKELSRRILHIINEFGGTCGGEIFDEDEVKFRYDSIIGMLLMASNDVQMMVKEWEEETQ